MRLQHHIDALLVLDAIDRRGSFASAAEELHRATSSITYAIQKLEEALGVELFNRDGHRSVLTSAGQELLRDGRMLINSIQNIENSVKLIASGWESVLRIAVNDIIPDSCVLNILEEFYQQTPNITRIRISAETFLGPWDALVTGRADFAIGIPGDVAALNNFQSHHFSDIEFVFVVAAHHPLAKIQTAIREDILKSYRAVAAADSSRVLQPRTFGLIANQPVLTVPDQTMKYLAIKRGLGVGHLPRHMIKEDLEAGSLIAKAISSNTGAQIVSMHYAWPSANKGKATDWFVSRLSDKKQPIVWFSH